MEDKPTTPTFDIEFAQASDRGQARELNEDYVAYRVPEEAGLLAGRGALFVVADGMGGYAAGEVASKMAVETVLGAFYEDPSGEIEAALRSSVQAANAAVHEQAQQQHTRSRMGTTLVAAAVRGNVAHVANVGDSRAYLIHAGRLEQVTEDHSWVQEQVQAGMLSHEESANHPRRSLITRALGLLPEVEVDLFRRTMEAGDALVLCSDGLWERVTDAEIEQTVVNHPPETATRRLVDLANQRGGPDNISLVILKVPPAKAGPARIEDRGLKIEDRRSRIEDRGSRIEDRRSKVAPPSLSSILHPLSSVLDPRLPAIGLVVAALAVLAAVGVLLVRDRGAPGTPTAPPTIAATNPPASPATTAPEAGATSRPAHTPAPTVTLRPTTEPGAAASPSTLSAATATPQPASPTPSTEAGSSSPGPAAPTLEPIATAKPGLLTPPGGGGGSPPGVPPPSPSLTPPITPPGDTDPTREAPKPPRR